MDKLCPIWDLKLQLYSCGDKKITKITTLELWITIVKRS